MPGGELKKPRSRERRSRKIKHRGQIHRAAVKKEKTNEEVKSNERLSFFPPKNLSKAAEQSHDTEHDSGDINNDPSQKEGEEP